MLQAFLAFNSDSEVLLWNNYVGLPLSLRFRDDFERPIGVARIVSGWPER